MTEDPRNTLRRALNDLNEGVRALLGQESTRLDIVSELLGTADDAARHRYEAAALERRRSSPRPPRPLRGASRRRRSSGSLFLVK